MQSNDEDRKKKAPILDLVQILVNVICYLMLWVLLMYGLYTGFMSFPVFLCAIFVSLIAISIEIRKIMKKNKK